MTNSHANVATISRQVQDVMVVEVNTASLNEEYEYSISDLENKIIRKGYFRAPLVQLRTSYMNDGEYLFHLYKAGKECFTEYFQKLDPLKVFESRLSF